MVNYRRFYGWCDLGMRFLKIVMVKLTLATISPAYPAYLRLALIAGQAVPLMLTVVLQMVHDL